MGAKRGSLAAQAQRDAIEQLASTYILDEYARVIEDSCGSRWCARALTAIYEGKKTAAQALARLPSRIQKRGTYELELVCALGDPQGYPGFIDPLVKAYGTYFAASGGRGDKRGRDQAIGAVLAAGRYFDDASSVTLYEKMKPLCEGLGVFLSQQHGDAGRECRMNAISMLCNAPVEAVAGPLASWIDVFVQYIENDVITVGECNLFIDRIDERTANGKEPLFASTLEPISKRLLAP
jgi:hypothetical protein